MQKCWCDECRKEYDKAYFQKNKSRRVGQVRDIRVANRIWVQEQKSKPCTDCGNTYPPEIMEFDHLGDKSFTISDGLYYSRVKIQAEIDKCELVCPTCHALRTLARRGVG